MRRISLPIFKSEPTLTKNLKIWLKKKSVEYSLPIRNIWSNQVISKIIPTIWKNRYKATPPLISPDLDLVIENINEDLYGVEVKYFRLNEEGNINLPYYAGIEESLGLLYFGLRGVILLHCFDDEITRDITFHYIATTDNFIRSLRLPISYKCLKVSEGGKGIDFVGLLPIQGTEYNEPRDFCWGFISSPSNPLLEDPIYQNTVTKIYDILKAKLLLKKD